MAGLDCKEQGPFEVTNTITGPSRESQAGPRFTLRNLPHQKLSESQISLDQIPVSAKLQPVERGESFYDNYTAASNGVEEVKGTLGDLKEGISLQGQTIEQLRDRIKEMHREVKLAIQQPPLPVPQLDDLRERMIAMAEGLHFVDVPGLHVKLDALKNDFAALDGARIRACLEELGAVTLANHGPPSVSPDLAGKLNLLASKENVEDVAIRLEQLQKEVLANITLILGKAEALKEQVTAAAERTMANVEATEVTPAPVMDLSSVHAKLDTISALVNSLMEHRKSPSAPPPTLSPPSALRSLSVFKNAHKAPELDSQHPNGGASTRPPTSPDVRSFITHSQALTHLFT
jgi:hypothetical protein